MQGLKRRTEHGGTANGDERPGNHVVPLTMEAHTGFEFHIYEGVLAVERASALCGGVVDDAFEVAVTAHQWGEQLARAIRPLHPHRVGAEHQHIGDQRVAQYREQFGQAEHA